MMASTRKTVSTAPIRLNLGCGPVLPAGWVNVDGSRRAFLASKLTWLDRALTACRILPATEFTKAVVHANLTRRFPWPDNSADAVYMGEVLEHFVRPVGEHVLKECLRVLKPGGILRVRVPDNARFWSNYLAEYHATRALPRNLWNDRHARWIGMFFRDICVQPRWIQLQSPGHYHKYMFDEISLVLAFEAAGFTGVERRAYHDSAIPDIAGVEARDELIVEGRKGL